MSDSEMAGWQREIHRMATRTRLQTAVADDGRTKQSPADQADINSIMKKYLSTGEFPVGRGPGRYGDFSGLEDYHSALSRVMAAQRAFDALPSHVRNYVRNDPGQLLALVNDPERQAEAEGLGLLQEVPEPPTPPVPSEPAPTEPAPDAEPAPNS